MQNESHITRTHTNKQTNMSNHQNKTEEEEEVEAKQQQT